jgi:hypothetical protein
MESRPVLQPRVTAESCSVDSDLRIHARLPSSRIVSGSPDTRRIAPPPAWLHLIVRLIAGCLTCRIGNIHHLSLLQLSLDRNESALMGIIRILQRWIDWFPGILHDFLSTVTV